MEYFPNKTANKMTHSQTFNIVKCHNTQCIRLMIMQYIIIECGSGRYNNSNSYLRMYTYQ